MEFIVLIFKEILYEPLLNALVFLYNIIPGHDLGIAIILLTLVIRVILFPLSQKGIRSQKALSALQPEIKKIQEKYKNEKEKQTRAIMEFYQKNKINPFSGCLPLLIQFPILIALYQVFTAGLAPEQLSILYPFVKNPGSINPMFLGLVDLSEKSSATAGGIVLALLAGFLQFVQSKTLMPSSPKSFTPDKSDFQNMMQNQMTYFMPIFTVVIVWNLKAGLPLYWAVTTLFSILQQYFIKIKGDTNTSTPLSTK